MVQIGIDFGGTKIEIAALDPRGEFLHRTREPTPRDYDGSIRLLCAMVLKTEAALGEAGSVGVALPGSISTRTGLIRNANSIWLNGRPFREDLARALGREVRVANDANCMALSEVVDGAAKGAASAFAVILGTGCGGGLVIDGRLVEGANGVAGEWGHMPLPWPNADEFPGPECWCGQRGCMETWVSGTGLRRDYASASGRQTVGEEIVAAARAGEAAAAEAFDRYLSRLGRGLAAIVNVVDPEVFVFGGGLSNVPEIHQRLPDAIRPYVFSDAWAAQLAPARWGDSSGVRGAARLW